MTMSGPPMRPNIARRRGTRPVRYIIQPRMQPLPTPTTNAGPRLNVHSCMARNASPTAARPAADCVVGGCVVLAQRDDGEDGRGCRRR